MPTWNDLGTLALGGGSSLLGFAGNAMPVAHRYAELAAFGALLGGMAAFGSLVYGIYKDQRDRLERKNRRP